MPDRLKKLRDSLEKQFPAVTVKSNLLSCMAFAADAGCYHKLPGLILFPGRRDEVSGILRLASEFKCPVTFRAAGTSLSGQSVSDSILLVASGDRWNHCEVLENGEEVRVEPGITGERINRYLKKFGRKFGPDPASLNSAMVGGIISNNASGMSCGTHSNSYSTLLSAEIVFADGSILDTSRENSDEQFRFIQPQIYGKLEDIHRRIASSPALTELIRKKYSIKNTTGYGMNSFTDFSRPVDILLHLMAGSEGTLGFVSEARFRTVKLLEFRASSMLYFHSLRDACNAVPELKSAGVSAIELMDREALRSVEDKPGIPDFIRDFPAGATALLIDLEAPSKRTLEKLMRDTGNALKGFNLLREFELTFDPAGIQEFWKIRKGVFPSVGGRRKPGTTVIIEDVAVRMDYLTEAVSDLRNLLDENGYGDAVIYGHALDGNLHFIFAQDFRDSGEVQKYKNLIDILTRLIVQKYQGSLKAEHGTGLNMAPFVRLEWGDEIYGMMKEIKQSFDPLNILNPGVIINDDPEVHLKDFKQFPLVDGTVDRCIECGFCEVNCLSSGFSLSARQRIVVSRGMKILKSGKGKTAGKEIRQLEKDFEFCGDKSCAADGLCSTSCPLDIDTGQMIKHYREEKNRNNKTALKTAGFLAARLKGLKSVLRLMLKLVGFLHRIFGTRIFTYITAAIHRLSFRAIPRWNPSMPLSAKKIKTHRIIEQGKGRQVVYFPSCINQTMGAVKRNEKSLVEASIEVLEKAGYNVLFPEGMDKLCCGTPWESKGFTEIANRKASELEKELLRISSEGKIPVMCDTSPCVYRMKKVMDKRLKIYEPVEFVHDHLLDKLEFRALEKKLAFHTTCSATKMGLTEKFSKIASLCTTHAVFPADVGCCGFAGDKGFSLPELNDWALRKLKDNVDGCEAGFSNSRTCEIGLSRVSGVDYRSVMFLVNECSRSLNGSDTKEES